MESFAELFEESLKTIDMKSGSIITGTVVDIDNEWVTVHAGLKSEGIIPRAQFYNDSGELEVAIGDSVQVSMDAVDDGFGETRLSREKAKRAESWMMLEKVYEAQEVIKGTISGRVKGGFTVEIRDVRAFLPGSLVDVRPLRETEHLEGKELEFKVIKLDQKRNNVVVSRRSVLEEENSAEREALLESLQEGQSVKGIVKNLTDYGAFVDLGGVDGLLHITDMAWKRIKHPSEIVAVGDEIDVKVLKFDRERNRVSLGLKQLGEDPWIAITKRYPEGTRTNARVTNLTDYGCFAELEEGVEGLVHISEMSWTKRINHPSEVLSVGEEVDVVVLDVDQNKQEISLGIKQTEVNPWELVAEKYPPGTVIEGIVRNLASYGAFVEIEPGIDGLLHVSDLSWTRKLTHPNEMLKKGETRKCVILEVDQQKQRVSLGLKQMSEDPWLEAIPSQYQPGMIVRGAVTKITNFGVFVELEDDLEGLLHISELADHKVEDPQDVVKVADEVEVKILRVDIDERKIGLSLKRAQWTADAETDPDSSRPTPLQPLRGGMGEEHGAMGTDKITFGPGGSKPAASKDAAADEVSDAPEAPQADEVASDQADEAQQAADVKPDSEPDAEPNAEPEAKPDAAPEAVTDEQTESTDD